MGSAASFEHPESHPFRSLGKFLLGSMAQKGYTSWLCKCNYFSMYGAFGRDRNEAKVQRTPLIPAFLHASSKPALRSTNGLPVFWSGRDLEED
jgi:hypothetical protein